MAFRPDGALERIVGAAATPFDLVIVGGGSGNSIIGRDLSEWSIALIDDGKRFGGTCLNAGCIPTKMFVHVADVAADAQDAHRFGVDATVTRVDWPAIRDRVFTRTDGLSAAGFRNRDEKIPNVTVFRDSFSFGSRHELVSASGRRIRGDRIVIAAGSRPRRLPVAYEPGPGIYDSDSIMRLDRLPDSLVIVGSGAIAAEFAHVFSALGVAVTQVARRNSLLGKLDADVAERFTELARTQWRVITGTTVVSIDRAAALSVRLANGESVETDAVLVAVGRIPNADTLGLGAVGFDLRADGRVRIDSEQRVLAGGSPVPGVFALGDVSSAWKLKHVANHQARVVKHNLMHPDDLVGGDPGPVPSAIFSRPQIAYFGVGAGVGAGGDTDEPWHTGVDATDTVTVIRNYSTTAFGWALEDETSFCKLVVDRGTGAILGAHIIGPQASILIQPLVLAASRGVSVHGLARSMYWPHPALTEVVENALLDAEREVDSQR